MPLKGYKSLCEKRAKRIVSRDKGNPQYHVGINRDKSLVTHYQIDGMVILEGNKCDFLLMNEEKKTAYLIELKGSDLTKAVLQLENTERALAKDLYSYDVYYRIVANRCPTHDIKSSEYRRFQVRCGKKLKLQTGHIEENI